MKKWVLIGIIAIFAVVLSGCYEAYPFVDVHLGVNKDCLQICVGNKFTYEGFETVETDEGKDILLHFHKKEGDK